jgi:hypothetical protein
VLFIFPFLIALDLEVPTLVVFCSQLEDRQCSCSNFLLASCSAVRFVRCLFSSAAEAGSSFRFSFPPLDFLFCPASSLLSPVRFGVPRSETHLGLVSRTRSVLGSAACVRFFYVKPSASVPAQARPQDLILLSYAGLSCADCFPSSK